MFNSALIYELAVLKLYAEPLLFAIDKDCPEYIEAKRLLKFLDYFLPMPGTASTRTPLSGSLLADRASMFRKVLYRKKITMYNNNLK